MADIVVAFIRVLPCFIFGFGRDNGYASTEVGFEEGVECKGFGFLPERNASIYDSI